MPFGEFHDMIDCHYIFTGKAKLRVEEDDEDVFPDLL